MIIRIALFITLLALFYNYGKDSSTTNQNMQREDANMRDLPIKEINPMINHDLANEAIWFKDTTSYFVSTRGTNAMLEGQFLSSVK